MSKDGSQGAAQAMKNTTFQVSVLRCKQTGQVLFLEAGKDFVDTILSFLLLPVGTIIHMLSNGPLQLHPSNGISCVFESVKNLDCSLLHVDKQTLVEPMPVAFGVGRSAGLLEGVLEAANIPTPSKEKITIPRTYYGCHGNCVYMSTKNGTLCGNCKRNQCNRAMVIHPSDLEELEADEVHVKEASSSSGQGFVRENITYMVTDSLEIMPSTTIRSIKVLNKLKVATLADLESTDATVTITQVLQLLQSAMTSTRCLNDVFGKKNNGLRKE